MTLYLWILFKIFFQLDSYYLQIISSFFIKDFFSSFKITGFSPLSIYKSAFLPSFFFLSFSLSFSWTMRRPQLLPVFLSLFPFFLYFSICLFVRFFLSSFLSFFPYFPHSFSSLSISPTFLFSFHLLDFLPSFPTFPSIFAACMPISKSVSWLGSPWYVALDLLLAQLFARLALSTPLLANYMGSSKKKVFKGHFRIS